MSWARLLKSPFRTGLLASLLAFAPSFIYFWLGLGGQVTLERFAASMILGGGVALVAFFGVFIGIRMYQDFVRNDE